MKKEEPPAPRARANTRAKAPHREIRDLFEGALMQSGYWLAVVQRSTMGQKRHPSGDGVGRLVSEAD